MTIGIDTNILLRMVLNDDPRQRELARAFGESLTIENPGYISVLVLVELNWALGSRYGQPKTAILSTVQRLLRTRTLVFESHDAVVRALERANGARVDFADALIAEHNLEQGCTRTMTFDTDAAASIPSMELLA